MPEVGTVHRSSSLVRLALAFYALVGGFVSFLAYAADAPRLADWPNAGITIQPNAAIAVMCAAGAVLLLASGFMSAARTLGAPVLAVIPRAETPKAQKKPPKEKPKLRVVDGET